MAWHSGTHPFRLRIFTGTSTVLSRLFRDFPYSHPDRLSASIFVKPLVLLSEFFAVTYAWTLDSVVPLLSASWMEPDRKLHIDVSFRSSVHWCRVALISGGICVGNFPPLHLMTDPGPGSETLYVKQAQYSKQRPSDAYSSLLSLYLGVQMFMPAVTSDKAPFVCKCEVDWLQLAEFQVLKTVSEI